MLCYNVYFKKMLQSKNLSIKMISNLSSFCCNHFSTLKLFSSRNQHLDLSSSQMIAVKRIRSSKIESQSSHADETKACQLNTWGWINWVSVLTGRPMTKTYIPQNNLRMNTERNFESPAMTDSVIIALNVIESFFRNSHALL